MDPVVHFEMPYENKERAARFYSSIFGWKTQLMGPDMGEYIVVQTGEVDEKNMLKEAGRINGGLFKKNSAAAGPSVVIAVEDIEATREKIRAAGGTVDDIMPIPGIGRYCAFIDLEGNRVSILQPDPRS